MTKNELFINKSKLLYGNKYSYNNTNYIHSKEKVTITCNIHGDFKVTPNNFFKGTGCTKCSGRYKQSNEEFISTSRLIFGNKYSYDKVNYINCETKIIITCQEHGDFEQIPNNHLQGKGCFKCGIKNITSDTEEFRLKSNNCHGDKYIYDKVNYVNNMSKVIITCRKHGDFEQLPLAHLQGKGCPICKESKGEAYIRNFLIRNEIKFEQQYTFNDLKYRGLLRFDFGIKEGDELKCLIEFNGRQHYEFNEYMHSDLSGFEEEKFKDNLKQDYCFEKNISLYIIKYDENIGEKLNFIWKKLKKN